MAHVVRELAGWCDRFRGEEELVRGNQELRPSLVFASRRSGTRIMQYREWNRQFGEGPQINSGLGGYVMYVSTGWLGSHVPSSSASIILIPHCIRIKIHTKRACIAISIRRNESNFFLLPIPRKSVYRLNGNGNFYSILYLSKSDLFSFFSEEEWKEKSLFPPFEKGIYPRKSQFYLFPQLIHGQPLTDKRLAWSLQI